MPNWCSNYATFTHTDPEQIQRLVNAAKAGKLFNEFLPCPPELLEEIPTGDDYMERRQAWEAANVEKFGYPSWYEWNIANWGTKWDIGEVDEDNFNVSEDGKSVSFWFDTAWAPPLNFYDDIEFTVTAYYNEEGMCFCGRWTSTEGDEYYDYNMDQTYEELTDNIPQEILDTFGILENIESWQESLEEDQDELDTLDFEEFEIEDGDMIDPLDRMEEIGAEFEEIMAQENDSKKSKK